MPTPVDEATDLLQTMIRNQCVNDGTPDSGGELRNAKTLEAYLAGPGMEHHGVRVAAGGVANKL